MNLAELGETFRNARVAAKMTQHQVAELSGVSRVRISLFETGALPEIGAAKMLSLFDSVGLELVARPPGHQRTLDDVLLEVDPRDHAPGLKRISSNALRRLKATEGDA
jgi:transcriptional regulator with XRE-family HTH domain